MEIIHFESIDSTNKFIKENVGSLSNFSIVSTDYQTSGKGREDRKWISANGENCLFSILIKDKELVNKFMGISLLIACVVRDYLEEQGIAHATIKWPNDVYVNDKKICGILLEGQIPNYLVIGVGLNVNQIEFTGDYRITPTSMALELNKKLENNGVLRGILKKIELYLKEFKEGKYDPVESANKYNYLKEKEVKILNHFGVVKKINKDCSLKIIENNKEMDIVSGEIKNNN